MNSLTHTYKIITCRSLVSAMNDLVQDSADQYDVTVLEIGLHNRPAYLRTRIQKEIDQACAQRYDAILFGYGLCGGALHGIRSREIPLVVARAHDCITLHLGSRQAYMQQHYAFPGTYWFSAQVFDKDEHEGNELHTLSLGSAASAEMQNEYQAIITRYGEENAAYLLQTMSDWKKKYTRAVYLESGSLMQADHLEKARGFARANDWTFEIMPSNFVLLQQLLTGKWDHNFLIVPAYHQIQMSGDEEIARALPYSG